MAGFRKVANNERCTIVCNNNSNSGASTPAFDDMESGTAHGSNSSENGNECSYSLKSTHYHCLVCDCSVLSRAQLSSHRHRSA